MGVAVLDQYRIAFNRPALSILRPLRRLRYFDIVRTSSDWLPSINARSSQTFMHCANLHSSKAIDPAVAVTAAYTCMQELSSFWPPRRSYNVEPGYSSPHPSPYVHIHPITARSGCDILALRLAVAAFRFLITYVISIRFDLASVIEESGIPRYRIEF